MSNDVETEIKILVTTLAQHPSIRAIGMSGGERAFPEPGKGDIDVFVYCTDIPGKDERQELLMSLPGNVEIETGKLEGGHWGQADCLSVAMIETWVLYFRVAEARSELEAILAGQYLGRLDEYYFPIGRCAMWKTMRVFYDPDRVLGSFKQRLSEYPPGLAQAVIDHHLRALEDVEDLERAVARKDVFFFHFALDLALDHFLQTLFALNKEYFPSRKRSELYLQGFKVRPAECEQRLRQVILLGANAETLEQSYDIWNRLVCDLKSVAGHEWYRK